MKGPDRAEKTLSLLVRAARAQIAEVKARIADLEAAKASAENSLDWLAQAMRAEEAARDEGRIVASEFARYLEGALEKKAALESTCATLAAELDAMRPTLAEAYAELKKLEHLIEVNRRAAARRGERSGPLRLRRRGAA